MDAMLTSHAKWIGQELGFTWKKFLLLVGLGMVLGLALALTVPLQVS
jgi:hypothetical protein